MNGYKAAFKGAMNAYGILATKAVRMVKHVTGLAGDSVEHYWPTECEQCKEIAAFLDEWQDSDAELLRAPDRSAIELLRTIRNAGDVDMDDFSDEFWQEVDAVLKTAGGG